MKPLMFDVFALIEMIYTDANSRDRATDLVKNVGTWFAKKFCKSSAEDKSEILLDVRPYLRAGGFDICDSDTGKEVGCDFCVGADLYGEGKHIEIEDTCVNVRMSHLYKPTLVFRANLSETYAFGFDMPISYCPMCGRRITGADE